ncbi:MAG: DUF983 domain-containing protein [Pseudomonadota bacterium]
MPYTITTDTQEPVEDRAKFRAMLRGFRNTCPKCGEGKLFGKWLKVEPVCKNCGEELHHERAHDLPPYLNIFIVGHIIVALLMVVEATVDLSLTAHLFIWVPLSLALSLALMQPLKGSVVGLQWALRMFGFGGDEDYT